MARKRSKTSSGTLPQKIDLHALCFRAELDLLLRISSHLRASLSLQEEGSPRLREDGSRLSLREFEPARAKRQWHTASGMNVDVEISSSSEGFASNAVEVKIVAGSEVGIELPYLRMHLEETVRLVVKLLAEEARLVRSKYVFKSPEEIAPYETGENVADSKHLSDLLIPDEFLRERDSIVRKIVSQFEKATRKRLGPRREKTEYRRLLDQQEQTDRLRKLLASLLHEGEKITKTGLARILGIGHKTKNPPASFNKWLKRYDIDFKKELELARSKLP